jgi:hypothetical protein
MKKVSKKVGALRERFQSIVEPVPRKHKRITRMKWQITGIQAVTGSKRNDLSSSRQKINIKILKTKNDTEGQTFDKLSENF